MRTSFLALPAVSLITALAVPALAQADQTPTRAETEDALATAQRALDGKGVTTGRELTTLLARVAAGRSKLRAADRREASALLARPTDGAADPFESGYATGVNEETPFCTTNFCVHYVASTVDAPDLTDTAAGGNGIPDVVETIADEMQNTVRPKENGTGAGQLGWRLPVSDAGLQNNGGNAKTDIYLKQLGTTNPAERSLYGYAAPEVLRSNNGITAPAFLVLDDDFLPAEYGGALAEKSRQATEAHEYNHVLQFAYDFLQDAWMAESTATWMENQVYPDVDDYVNYLGTSPRAWRACLATPLTTFNPSDRACGLKVYGSAVWNHWLSTSYSPVVVRRAQERSGPNGDFAVGAYEDAIQEQNGLSSFASEFELFANAASEWDQTLGANPVFPDSYADLPRAGTVSADGAALDTQSLNNTTFRLFSVPADSTKARYRLHADLPAGLSGGVGLVGRAANGTVDSSFAEAEANGAADVTLDNPGNYQRITAVIVNSDTTRLTDANGDPALDDDAEWLYARNAQPFCNVRVTSNVNGAGTAAACPAPPAAPNNPSPPPAAVATPPARQPAAKAPVPALTYRLTASARQKRASVLKRGVSVSLTCNQRCSASATLTLDRPTAKKLKLSRTLGKASTRLSKAGKKSFRVKLGRKARAALRKRSRLKATLTLRTKGTTGATKTAKRTITIVR